MGFLPEKPNLRLFAFVVIGIFAVCFCYYIGTITSMRVVELPQQINLADVKVAYVPETEEVVILDRKTTVVKYVLSKEVTVAIFTLKSTSIQQNYLNAGQDSKSKSVPNKVIPNVAK